MTTATENQAAIEVGQLGDRLICERKDMPVLVTALDQLGIRRTIPGPYRRGGWSNPHALEVIGSDSRRAIQRASEHPALDIAWE